MESGSPHIAVLLAKGRSRRLGVQQRALPQLALGCLDSARDLHRGAGRERAAGHGASLFFFFFICVVCLKILQHSFAAVCLRLKPMPLMRSHGGLDADRRCQNTSDPTLRRLGELSLQEYKTGNVSVSPQRHRCSA